MPFKRILAAVDFSEPITAKVLETTVDIAKCMGSEIILMNVVEKEIPMLVSKGFLVPSADIEVIEKIMDRVTKESEKRLTEIATEIANQHSLKVLPVVEVGMPFERILAKAKEYNVDLIVVGAHAKSGIEKLLLGSVSEKVARKADTNVLIVRTEEKS